MLSNNAAIDDVSALSASIPHSEPCMCRWLILLRDGRTNDSIAYCVFAWQDASPNGRDIGEQVPLISRDRY